MLLFLIAMTLGAALGWRRATLRGGDRLDRLQYAAAHAICFALATLVGVILVERLT
jgi:phosphate/sulfate permease